MKLHHFLKQRRNLGKLGCHNHVIAKLNNKMTNAVKYNCIFPLLKEINKHLQETYKL